MEEQNPIHNFLTECTIKNRSADPIKLTTLYKKYKLYVLEEEEYEISRNAFSKILQEMNYKKGRNNQGVIFYGLELNHESKYIKPRDIMYE